MNYLQMKLKYMYKKIRTRPTYVALLLIFVLMFFHIEFATTTGYAPPSMLVRVLTPEGSAELNAKCYGDVFVDNVQVKKKEPLTKLNSLYEVVDVSSFFVSNDKGFYQLQTGLEGSEEQYEVRVVCYSPNFEGVSHTIVNNNNDSGCTIATDGAVIIC